MQNNHQQSGFAVYIDATFENKQVASIKYIKATSLNLQ